MGTASGQYNKVVVIDTITKYDAPPNVRKIEGKVDTFEWLLGPLHASHVMQVYFIDTSKNLQILIDDKSGYIELKNTFHIAGDTIRIAHIRIFHNCTPDSVYTTKDWYLRDPTKAEDGLKYLRTEYYNIISQKHLHKHPFGKEEYKRLYDIKECKKDFPNEYRVSINGQQYIVPLYFRWEDRLRTVGHGYKSHRHYKKYYKRNKAAIYFHYHSRTIYHLLHAEVTLLP